MNELGAAVAQIDVIRALGMLDGAVRLVYRDAQAARSEHLLAQHRNEIVTLVAKPIRALAQVLVMGLAAWLVLENGRSPAIIFAATLLFGRALAPIEGAIAGWKAFALTMAAYRRLNGVLAVPASTVAASAVVLDRPYGELVVDDVKPSPRRPPVVFFEAGCHSSHARRVPRHHWSVRIRQIRAGADPCRELAADAGPRPAR